MIGAAALSGIAEKLGVCALCGAIGFAWGEHRTTESAVSAAVETVETAASREFAAATGEIAQQVKEANAALNAQAAKARTADDRATAAIAAANAAAQTDRNNSLKELSAEQKMENVIASEAKQPSQTNLCTSPQPFTWSGAARSLLDRAAGAGGAAPLDSGDPDPERITAGGTASGAAAALAAAAAQRRGSRSAADAG
jgi:hypothetical protein